jgi:hypothetical protein
MEEIAMATEDAPIVTVPKAAAPDRGSVGEQIRREWAVLRKYVDDKQVFGLFPDSRMFEAIRKLDALIGYDGGKLAGIDDAK